MAIPPALALWLVQLLNAPWRSESGWVALLLAIGGGVAAEFWAVLRVKSSFSAEVAPKAIALLRGTRTFWWWRFVMLGGVLAGVLLWGLVTIDWAR